MLETKTKREQRSRHTQKQMYCMILFQTEQTGTSGMLKNDSPLTRAEYQASSDPRYLGFIQPPSSDPAAMHLVSPPFR